jgi:soluble cytochrome b562
MHIGYITKYINHQVPKNYTKPIQILISKITKLEKLAESGNIIGQKQ